MAIQYSFSSKKFPKLVVMNNESVCAAIIIAIIKKKQKHNGTEKRIWKKQWLKDKENLGDVKPVKKLETS